MFVKLDHRTGNILISASSIQNKEHLQVLLTELKNVQNKWSTIIFNSSREEIELFNVATFKTISNYIMYFNSIENFEDDFQHLKNLQILNQKGCFLIISNNRKLLLEDNNFKIAQEIYKILEKYNIYRAVFLGNSSNGTFSLFKSVQFENGKCKINFKTDLAVVDSCTNGKYISNISWYNLKIPKKFKFCRIRTVFVDVPPFVKNIVNTTNFGKQRNFIKYGIDIAIIGNLFRNMNIIPQFIESKDFGDVDLINGTGTGALGMLIRKEAELAVGGYAHTFPRHKFLECSVSYVAEPLIWLVPRQKQSYINLMGLIQAVQINVWLLTGFLLAFSMILIVLISRNIPEEKTIYQNPIFVLEGMLRILLNFTLHSLPQTDHVRAVFSMILIFGLIFNATYTTYLVSVLTSLKYTDKYSNTRDIFKNNLSIYLAPNSAQYFTFNSTLDYYLVKQGIPCNVLACKECLEDIAYNRNFALLGPKLYLKLKRRSYLDSSGEYLIKALKNPPVSVPLNLITQKGFWGYHEINRFIFRLVESGLIEKWIDISKHSKNTDNNSTLEIILHQENLTKTLAFKDLRILFYFICIGEILSIIVFILELIIFKYISHKK